MTGPVPGWNEGCRDDGPGADRGYLEFGQDEPQCLGGPGSGAPAAVADDPGGLAVPLPVDVVQGVLQGSGAGVVALGDEDAVDEGLRDSNPATKRRGRGKRAGRSRNRGPEKAVTTALGILLLAERMALLSGRDDEFVAGVNQGLHRHALGRDRGP